MVMNVEIGGKQIWKRAINVELESLLLWKKTAIDALLNMVLGSSVATIITFFHLS